MNYIYRCPRCGDFEVKHPITAPSLTRCPNCEGKVRRVIRPLGFYFKEKNYVKDFR